MKAVTEAATGRVYRRVHDKLPPPAEDEKRCMFLLDPLKDAEAERDDYMLELLPGRIERVDTVNRHFISGSVTAHEVPGHNYTYYTVKLGPVVAATRYAPLPGVMPVEKFVSLKSPQLIHYNSGVPVVVYLPKDAQLRYRLWKGGETSAAMEQ
ncbi:putative ecotin [Trypanosoma theileri]|uniref:Putative ecotin n=1 Tax=Trypanosoma theileri TaxID=67003 RepID=A0A1X0NV40_9TRYP|nr:putative ecotin [Trypanosoma theileri]ORC88079.1 putative ecotin [Trypanosoma theileri]